MAEEKKESSKIKSRKFFVFIVWIVITIGILTFCIITKGNSQIMEKVLEYLFWVSIAYIGGNVGQKVGLAALQKKEGADE